MGNPARRDRKAFRDLRGRRVLRESGDLRGRWVPQASRGLRANLDPKENRGQKERKVNLVRRGLKVFRDPEGIVAQPGRRDHPALPENPVHRDLKVTRARKDLRAQEGRRVNAEREAYRGRREESRNMPFYPPSPASRSDREQWSDSTANPFSRLAFQSEAGKRRSKSAGMAFMR